MKIWEILKRKNMGKKYKTKIYGIDEIVKVDYDSNSNSWLNIKRLDNSGVVYPLHSIFLGAILEMDFEEV